jgi:hypothetical protein
LPVTCATIASCDDFEDIVEWGEHHLDFLRQFSEPGCLCRVSSVVESPGDSQQPSWARSPVVAVSSQCVWCLVAAFRAREDRKAELEQLAVNALRSPKRVLNRQHFDAQNAPARMSPDATPGQQEPGRLHESAL